MEALEEWQKAKDAFRAFMANPDGDPPPAVPLHDVSIEIFTGASAGGMCAAISSVMVQQDFDHIRSETDAQKIGTNNVFYESWVNLIDIRELLKTDDLQDDKPVVSLLDCTIIDRIAVKALTPDAPVLKPYIAPNLTLMLTLSNVRGTPYQLYSDPSGKLGMEEFVEYFGDKLRFEVTQDGKTSTPVAKPLPAGKARAPAWPLLQEAAKATGAFPIFLAPRIITRDVADYDTPPWKSLPDPNSVKPSFSLDMPSTWQTLNVDGGVTDNNPFNLAHDFLASQNPTARDNTNPRDPLDANCAVITVAPFPAEDKFNPDFDLVANQNPLKMLPRLFDVLIAQSRFGGESLEQLTSGTSFSRFTIAPSDDPKLPDGSVLMCGLLGAFGGFFERGFRAHDFLLGRRNCQKFLQDHFCLPKGNPIVDEGLKRAGEFADTIGEDFFIDPPNDQVDIRGEVWMPLIPLVGSAKDVAPEPARPQMSRDSLDEIVDGIVTRARALKSSLLKDAPEFARAAAEVVLNPAAVLILKPKLRRLLEEKLCPFVEGQTSDDCPQTGAE
jgi:hypothetical protein